MARREAESQSLYFTGEVGLKDKANFLSGSLPRQQQRAIARALAYEPIVMLFDDLTSALDPEMVAKCWLL